MADIPLWRRLDVLHPIRRGSQYQNRDVFGVKLPAHILFHAVLGYVLPAVGLAAILLRLPPKFVQRYGWLHPHLGMTWVFGTIWIAVTAIWCVHKFVGWDVIAFFIFSLYAAVQLGWVFIRIYNRQDARREAQCDIETTKEMRKGRWIRIWKWLHATAMIYSFCMLLGAGISFPFRSHDDYKKTIKQN